MFMLLKEKKLMMSLHLKATMMKISDPVLFGHCVQVYYKVKPQSRELTIWAP